MKKELAHLRGDDRPAEPSTGPVFFVVGYQKSGTTWLMRMLDSHPEILCRGEGRFFDGGWRQESLKRRNAERPPGSLYNALLDAGWLRLWIERSVWSRDGDPDEHLNNLTRLAVDYFLKGKLLQTGKRLVGDKSPLLTTETMGEIAGIYPEARVIHIIRDGRDAAVSALHHTWNFGGMKNPETLAKRDAYMSNLRGPRETGESAFTQKHLRKLATDWSARVGRATEDGPSLLGPNYTEVRYETLLERPEEELEKLLSFLGADSDAETVRRCVRAASFEKLSKGRKPGEEDASSFFRKGVAGDWKNVFTEEDRQVFKEVAGDLLVRLGYEKDGGW